MPDESIFDNPDLKADDLDAVEAEKELPVLPPGRTAPPLDEYVGDAMLAARREGERKLNSLPPAQDAKEQRAREQDIERRVQAAAAYARRRHFDYRAGQVASL
jgi:hypothetical protein